MRNTLLGATAALAATVAVWSLASIPAVGQAPMAKPTSFGGCPAETLAFHTCALEKAKTFDPPRTPDGKPDMQGYWRDQLTHGFSVEGVPETEPETKNLVQPWPVGPGMIVDPPDRKIPYQPWAAKIGRKGENYEKYIDPTSSCRPYSPPRDVQVSPFHQLLQPPGGDSVVWLMEEVHSYRMIYTDGRPHLGKDIKLWKGDAIGRWEGNTLVVDVTNFNGYTWLDDLGNFYTDTAHVVDRWTMIDPDTMHYEVTIEDPNVYTRPWKMAWPIMRDKAPGLEILEEACWEGERDLVHFRARGYTTYFGQTWRSRQASGS